jgi:hypothetical protein
MMFIPHRRHPYGPPWPVTGTVYFLYADDVRTSQEAHVSTVCNFMVIIIIIGIISSMLLSLAKTETL